MKRTILLYSVSLAVLVVALKLLEYRFLVQRLSLEIYLGTVALLFTGFGVWAGKRLTRPTAAPPLPTTPPSPVSPELVLPATVGISKREYEVLALMALGLSNQEIADVLFVSLNTIKTHTSNLFLKLDAKRRTQAIQHAKERRLIA